MKPKTEIAPTARKIKEAQALRLLRLRDRIVGVGVTEAAAMAGVTRHTWARMEAPDGTAIDTVSLAMFCREAGVSPLYVLTGSYEGMDADTTRMLVQIEADDQAVLEGRMPAQPLPVRRGRKRQTRMADNEPEAMRAGAEQAPASAGRQGTAQKRMAKSQV